MGAQRRIIESEKRQGDSDGMLEAGWEGNPICIRRYSERQGDFDGWIKVFESEVFQGD